MQQKVCSFFTGSSFLVESRPEGVRRARERREKEGRRERGGVKEWIGECVDR